LKKWSTENFKNGKILKIFFPNFTKVFPKFANFSKICQFFENLPKFAKISQKMQKISQKFQKIKIFKILSLLKRSFDHKDVILRYYMLEPFF